MAKKAAKTAKPEAAKRQVRQVRVLLRQRQGRRQPHMKDAARRQGLRPRRDDQRRPAGAARLHDLHRGLHHLLRREADRSRRRSKARCRPASQKLEKAAGATLGRPKNPLLVSVRSGAKFSMPGMMDTILNLGLNDAAVEGLEDDGRRTAASPSTATAASSRCSATSCSRSRRTRSRHEFEAVKKTRSAKLRHRPRRDGAARRLKVLSRATRRSSRTRAGKDFPQDPRDQLEMARERRVPLLDEPARDRVPPHLRHPRSHRHRRQRADDGVRQHRRSLGHRRRLHPQPGDRRRRSSTASS